MREVTKAEFKRVYLERGGGAATGWTLTYWERCVEPQLHETTRFVLEDPPTPQHTRMMIVAGANEHRLFFLTEEAEESFFEGLEGD